MLWRGLWGGGGGRRFRMAIIMVRTNGCMIEREVDALDGVQVIINNTQQSAICHLRGCDCNKRGHSDKGGQEEVGYGAR